jgi:LmbE family N-acetylglucosaminyl deacetylase
MKERVLIVAAHPDDEVLGCGGFIAKQSDKFDIYVLFLTNGASGRFSDQQCRRHLENAQKANDILGTKQVVFLDFPNQKLETVPLIDVTQAIEKQIAEIKPFRVFTHDYGDLNKDHQITFEAVSTAVRAIPEQIVKELFTYYVPSSSEWGRIQGAFTPNVWLDITEVLDKKLEAMRAYDSEGRAYPHPRNTESLKSIHRFFGINSGMECAEPFKLIHSIGFDW